MKTGELIGAMAKGRGVSLRQLAMDAGIPYNTLYAIVRRKSTRIDLETLQRIAESLRVPIASLLMDQESLSRAIDNGLISPEEISAEMAIPLETVADIINQPDEYDPRFVAQLYAVSVMLISELRRMDQEQLVDFINASPRISHLSETRLLLAFRKLNPDGQEEAVKRIEELAEIPKYQKDKEPPQPE